MSASLLEWHQLQPFFKGIWAPYFKESREYVACYIDDILISNATHEAHLSTLKEVFNRL
jgi:hypothetical protein